MTEFAFVLDDVTAGADPGMNDIQSSGQPREYQENGLDAASMRAISIENMAAVHNGKHPPADSRNPF
jgi:hypothetical protein